MGENAKSGITLNASTWMHVVNLLMVFSASLYFVFQLEKTIALLDQQMQNISESLAKHTSAGAHGKTRVDIRNLAVSAAKLLEVTQHHEKTIVEIKDDARDHRRNGNHK